MNIQSLKDYLSAQLPNASCRKVYGFGALYLFLLIVTATTCVDLVSGVPITFRQALLFGCLKAGAYVSGIGLATLVVFGLTGRFRANTPIPVATIWIISFLGYLTGFLLLAPYRAQYGHLSYHGSASGWELFVRLIPVWGIFTYLLIQQCLKRSLEQALRRFDRSRDEEIHTPLSDKGLMAPAEETTDFGGQLRHPIQTVNILFVHIIEHYAYITVVDGVESKVVELKASLNSLKRYLPDPPFAQPHRSYLVNTSHVSGIKKQGREAVITFRQSAQEIPVSRYRLIQFTSSLSEKEAIHPVR